MGQSIQSTTDLYKNDGFSAPYVQKTDPITPDSLVTPTTLNFTWELSGKLSGETAEANALSPAPANPLNYPTQARSNEDQVPPNGSAPGTTPNLGNPIGHPASFPSLRTETLSRSVIGPSVVQPTSRSGVSPGVAIAPPAPPEQFPPEMETTSPEISPIPPTPPAFLPNPTPSPPTPSPSPPIPPTPSPPLNYGEALQKSFLFYEAQRSGALPDDNRIAWRGDSALADGASVGLDLSGGYYDAGDHLKFTFPTAAAMTLLSWGVLEYHDGYQQSGQLDEALAAIRWGTDWLLKTHVVENGKTQALWVQVGDVELDHNVWNAAETLTMVRPAYRIDAEHPGSEIAGETAAALAAASLVFRPTDPAYADKLLTHAMQLYAFAETYPGRYGESEGIAEINTYYRSRDGYADELAWGAAWIHRALDTQGVSDQIYLQKAVDYYPGINQGWTLSWGDKSQAAAILLAEETQSTVYREEVEGWLDGWLPGSAVAYTPGGLAWLNGWGSLRYSANTAFLAGIYGDRWDTPNGAYSQFAESQIDYILGDNPQGISYMVGFGEVFPERIHHRGASGLTRIEDLDHPAANTQILYGALVGGPTAPQDGAYQDSRLDYRGNETAIDYNAAFTGALARMYSKYGGTPLSNEALNTLPGLQIPGLAASSSTSAISHSAVAHSASLS